MPPKRESDDTDIERARAVREVREHDQKPRTFESSNIVFRFGQLLAAVGAVWGIAIAFSNYNYRLTQQDARIRRLERQVVYTSEWRAWHKVAQLQNAGKVDLPDPNDFTTDRTE